MAFGHYYVVPDDCYLFREKLKNEGSRKQHEESVRQWCLQELIRCYGFTVSELEIETPVRAGSGTHWIDILIRRDGRPWAVVETKERRKKNLSRALEQAISYGNAQSIQAEFAVATNGHALIIFRRVNHQWLPVPELPNRAVHRSEAPLYDLLHGWQLITRILYKLDSDLAGSSARYFLDALAEIFRGENIFTVAIDRRLRLGTDNLLRSTWAAGDDASKYRYDKLGNAVRLFEEYRRERNLKLPIELTSPEHDLRVELRRLHSILLAVLPENDDLVSVDVLVLRFAAALAEYGSRRTARVLYPRIGPALHRGLRDLLDFVLALTVNAKLPHAVDTPALDDIRGLCYHAWREFEAEKRKLDR